MKVLFFAIFWYSFLVFIAFQFQKRTKCFTNWNTFTIFLLLTFISHGIYVPFTLSINKDFGVDITNSQLMNFIINLFLMYIFILVGMVLTNKKFRFVPDFSFKLPEKIGVNPLVFWPLLILMVALLVYKLRLVITQYNLASFILRTLSPEEYKAARIYFGQSGASSNSFVLYIVNVAAFAFFPLAIYSLYFIKHFKKQLIFKVLFWLVLVLVCYHAFLSGHKASLIIIFLGILICQSIMKHGLYLGYIFKRLAMAGFLIFFAVIPYLYMIQYDGGYLDGVYRGWYRLAVEPNRALQLYYYTYPEKHSFLLGTSSQLIGKIVGVSSTPPHTYIPKEVFDSNYTTWPAIFIADSWADFGFLGTIFSSFIVGFLLQFYNVWFAQSNKSALALGTFVALIISCNTLARVGLFTSFLTYGVISTFIIYLFSRELSWLRDDKNQVSIEMSR